MKHLKNAAIASSYGSCNDFYISADVNSGRISDFVVNQEGNIIPKNTNDYLSIRACGRDVPFVMCRLSLKLYVGYGNKPNQSTHNSDYKNTQ